MEHQGWKLEENNNLSTNRRSTRPQEELVELLWRDGQVIQQSQTHRVQTQAQTQAQTQTQIQYIHQETLTSNIFLEDQESLSWIQYPPDEYPFESEDFSSHFFSTEKPISKTVNHEEGQSDPPQVMLPPKFRLADSSSGNKKLGKEQYSVMTVGPSHCGSNQSQDASMNQDNRSKTSGEKLYPNTNSSSGGSSSCSLGKNIIEMASGGSITTDHKRKHILNTKETVTQSDANKRSGSMRRSRAAEVHNLSERRRRDRINERMKALQELIPHCSKTDKASILDEAIDYLKSLQLQLQVMWMGSGMAATPMMFPGVQSPPFMRQMQSPQLPRFPIMDQPLIHNNPGLVYQNSVQNQVLSDRFARYISGLPQMQPGSQSVEMSRFGSLAGDGGQKPSEPSKTTDGLP